MMPLRPQTIGPGYVPWLFRQLCQTAGYDRRPPPLWAERRTYPLRGCPWYGGRRARVIPMGAGNTGNQFIGVAGREVKSASEFYSQNEGRYGPGRTSLRIPARVHQRKVPEGRSGGGWEQSMSG